MSAANPHLRRIKAEFERHGIRAEVQIAEATAFLLLIYDRREAIRDLRGDALRHALESEYQSLVQAHANLVMPRPLPVAQWGQDNLHEMVENLGQAIANSPHHASLGQFFQREIRPELLKGSTGPQYPTPYHIADLIAALAVSEEQPRVLDPTAGSAGLLVSALRYAPNAILTGYDFDPLWAALGSANLILNGAQEARYEAVSVLNRYAELEGQFDGVVMNPPFGGSRSTGEVAETVGEEYGRGNANVMAALAIQALRPGGRSAFLVPSGTLFGSGAEANLRRLFTNHHLEAIVTLPKSAFQPHSNIEAHLIVIRKREDGEAERPTAPVWFCQVERDGYPEGADRDITLEPQRDEYELPRIRELVLQNRQNNWVTRLNLAGVGEIQSLLLRPADGLPAIGIRCLGDHPEIKWEALQLPSNRVAVKVRDAQSRLLGWLALPYEGDWIWAVTNENIAEHNWDALIPTQVWGDDIAQSWQAEPEDLTVTIQPGETLTIQRDRTRSIFVPQSDQALMACLVRENGDPLTPWLRLNQARQPKDIEEDFNVKYQAISLFDANDQPAGWIIGLSTGEEGNEAQPLQKAFLIVMSQPQARLFVHPENPNGAVVFCDSGWLQIFPGEAPSLSVEFGANVQFRRDRKIVGFAIGPAPWKSTGYHMFGVLVHREEFDPNQDGRGNYLPSQFLPEPEAAPVAHPLDVLADIRKKQVRLASKVDALFGVLGGAQNLVEEADLGIEPPDWITEMLDERQKAFWGLLSSKKVDGRPAHFNLTTIKQWCAEANTQFDEDEISRQLELFIGLGLIVQVHAEDENMYRCLKKGDVLASQGVAV